MRNGLMFAGAALLLASLLWRNGGPVTAPPEAQVDPKPTIGAQSFAPATKTSAIVAAPEPPAIKLADEEQPKDTEHETENQCWTAMMERYPQTPGFGDYMRRDTSKLVGDWYLDFTAPITPDMVESALEGKFFLALAYSGNLAGRQVPVNYARALELLREVQAEDSDNSAPLLFMALMERKRGNTELAEALLNEAAQKTRFDTYMKTLRYSTLMDVRSPNDMIAANTIWAQAPIVDVSQFKSLITQTKHSSIALQMMKDGLEGTSSFDGLDWMSLEYTVGKSILKKMGLGQEYPEGGQLMTRSLATFECKPDAFDKALAIIHSQVQR